jgi:hypothetical protein
VKAVRFALLMTVLSVIFLITQPARPVQAQAPLSAGCTFINSGALNTTSSPGSGFGLFFAFNAGEVITISASFGTATAAQFAIESPFGTTVAGPTSVPGTLSYTIPTTGTQLIGARNLAGSNGTVVWNWKCGLPSAASGSAVKFFDPGDDRLNREPGQPAALYCRNQGDVHIYEVNVDDSKGKLALVITKAEIDAVVNANPSANTLIKQSGDGKYKLYYLPATKELSFITHENGTGKQYSHVWKGLCR